MHLSSIHVVNSYLLLDPGIRKIRTNIDPDWTASATILPLKEILSTIDPGWTEQGLVTGGLHALFANIDPDWTGSGSLAGFIEKMQANIDPNWSSSGSLDFIRGARANINPNWSGSGALTFDYNFKWSIEHLEASNTHGFSSVYVDISNIAQPTGTFPIGDSYDRKLLEIPRLQEVNLNSRSGVSGFQRVTLQVDNSDGIINSINLQDAFVRIFFVDESGNDYREFNGKVVDWTLSHVVTINVEDIDALAFTEDLPKRTLNDLVEAEKTALEGQEPALTEFTNSVVADDLGKPIPIIFGRAVKVPLLYIKADETLVGMESKREYDYIIGEGVGLNGNNFDKVFTVYRDERTLGDIEGPMGAGSTTSVIVLDSADNNPDNFYQYWWCGIYDDAAFTTLIDIEFVASSSEDSTSPTVTLNSPITIAGGAHYRLREYRFYDGSQASPYAGYAFIRSKKRFGTTNRTDDLYADVNGLPDEVNRVRAIQSLLSNPDWGLGLAVDSTSFDTAADIIWDAGMMQGISAFSCEGAILSQTSATDIFSKLLSFRDMVLSKDEQIQIVVDESKATGFNFGLGDETGYNNILDTSPSVTYVHPNEKTKNLKVRYRKNHRENDTYLQEFSRSSSTNGVDDTLDLPFVYDHSTADKALDYKRKRLAAAERTLSLSVGEDGKKAKRGDRVSVDVPTIGLISSDWEVVGSNVGIAGSNSLDLVPYSDTPYTYEAFADLPSDPTEDINEPFDIPPDYTNSAPFPVTNVSVTMLMDTLGVTPFPYAKLTWTAPEDNYGGAAVSVKLHSEGGSEWRDVGTFSDTSAKVESLTPGQLYDFRITSLNVTGEHKGLAVIDDNLGNGHLAGGDGIDPNIPTGLTGNSKFGDLIWTWTNSTSNDVLYHEIEIYSASVGGTLLDRKKYYRDDTPQHVYKRQTGDLTSNLNGWARVRAVDYSGNPTDPNTGWTSRVQATTDDILQDDIEEDEVTRKAMAQIATRQNLSGGSVLVSVSFTARNRPVSITARANIVRTDGGVIASTLHLRRDNSQIKSFFVRDYGDGSNELTKLAMDTVLDTNPGNGPVTYDLYLLSEQGNQQYEYRTISVVEYGV